MLFIVHSKKKYYVADEIEHVAYTLQVRIHTIFLSKHNRLLYVVCRFLKLVSDISSGTSLFPIFSLFFASLPYSPSYSSSNL